MEFGEYVKLELRTVWENEASDFTPWLEQNINNLGDALGMELELEKREASVGSFSLDLLAKNLGTGEYVVIENQLTRTDHQHLGKLLTYAAGFNASTIIWIAESIRDEYRQTLEWLNQNTYPKIQFFAVVIEVFKIDNSKPTFKFQPIVFPNEWQKTNRRRTENIVSPRAESYRIFFQKLIDDLRDIHKFTGARIAQPQSWYSFGSGYSGLPFATSFAQGSRVRVELYIDKGDVETNKLIFDELKKKQNIIEKGLGFPLSWGKLEEKQASRIAIYREGSIDNDEAELEDIKNWAIENLLKFKKIFPIQIKGILSKINKKNKTKK